MPDVTGFSALLGVNTDNINKYVPRKPGCYVLDRTTTSGFEVCYTGRADVSLEDRLKDYVGSKYRYFKFLELPDKKSAFEMECKVFHNLKPVDNVIHPDAPNGTSYICPMAGCPNGKRSR